MSLHVGVLFFFFKWHVAMSVSCHVCVPRMCFLACHYFVTPLPSSCKLQHCYHLLATLLPSSRNAIVTAIAVQHRHYYEFLSPHGHSHLYSSSFFSFFLPLSPFFLHPPLYFFSLFETPVCTSVSSINTWYISTD